MSLRLATHASSVTTLPSISLHHTGDSSIMLSIAVDIHAAMPLEACHFNISMPKPIVVALRPVVARRRSSRQRRLHGESSRLL